MDKIKGDVDFMMFSETKLDNTFPNGQFLIDGFNKPIRLDRYKNGGGILFFIRLFIEINLYEKKWLLCCSYNPDSNNIKNHLSALNVS